jgi:hypothetical protein
VSQRVTIATLLLGGWHQVSNATGVWWCHPKMIGSVSFTEAAKLYKAGLRDE